MHAPNHAIQPTRFIIALTGILAVAFILAQRISANASAEESGQPAASEAAGPELPSAAMGPEAAASGAAALETEEPQHERAATETSSSPKAASTRRTSPAEAATTKSAPATNSATNTVVAETISQIVQREIAHSLEGEYEDRKNWGKTTKIVNGLKFKGQGLNVTVQPHTKEVNNGLWQKYRVAVVDPERQLHVHVENLRSTGPGRIAFRLNVSALLEGQANVERWWQGIKTLNFSADADCSVEAGLDCEVGFKFAPGSYLADLVIEPRITAVQLRLVRFDLKRFSKIGGTAAHELGEGLKSTVAKELRKREPKIAEKLNHSLEKHQDALRISPQKLLTSGFSKVTGLLGADSLDAAAHPAGEGK